MRRLARTSRTSYNKRFVRSLLQIAGICAVAFTTRASLADHYRVPTGSMEPTVAVGDHILVSKIAYGLRVPLTDEWIIERAAPARGDVVILDVDEPTVLLKRVVAVEGDLVEVRGGRVSIDGAFVDEPNASLASGGGPDFGPTRVPKGQLLVLGDNRGNSRDGRELGFVDRTRILGRAVAVIGRNGDATYKPL